MQFETFEMIIFDEMFIFLCYTVNIFFSILKNHKFLSEQKANQEQLKPSENIRFGVIGVFLSLIIWMSVSEFYFPQVIVPKSLHLIVDVIAIIGIGVGVIWIIQSRREKN